MKNFLLNAFEDFITGNGIWILVGCLAFALIVSVVFLYLNIQKEKKEAEKNKKALIERLAEQYAKKQAEKLAVEKQAEKQEEVKAEKVVTTKRKTTTKKSENKEASTTKKAKTIEKKVEQKVEENAESGDYEISYDEEAKEWVVKRTNLTRATKRTRTKQQAIEYAKPLAEKNGVKLIVHTKNN